MRTTILILTMNILFCSSVLAQVFPLLPKFYQPLDSSVLVKDTPDDEPKEETLMKHHEKLSYSVTVGAGYSSFGSNASMMSSYIAPSIDYQVNSKLYISVNGMIMQNSMNGFESNFGAGSQYSYNSSPQNYGISGSAFYQLSDRWSIYGDGAFLENQSVFNDYRAEMYTTDYKTVSLGVGYKVSDNVHFSIQYRYSNGLDPAYNFSSPYNRSGFGNYRSNYNIWDY